MLGASYFYPSFSDRLYELNCLSLELESEIWGRKGLEHREKDDPPVQADEKKIRAARLWLRVPALSAGPPVREEAMLSPVVTLSL